MTGLILKLKYQRFAAYCFAVILVSSAIPFSAQAKPKARITPGMTKAQVLTVLGEPTTVENLLYTIHDLKEDGTKDYGTRKDFTGTKWHYNTSRICAAYGHCSVGFNKEGVLLWQESIMASFLDLNTNWAN